MPEKKAFLGFGVDEIKSLGREPIIIEGESGQILQREIARERYEKLALLRDERNWYRTLLESFNTMQGETVPFRNDEMVPVSWVLDHVNNNLERKYQPVQTTEDVSLVVASTLFAIHDYGAGQPLFREDLGVRVANQAALEFTAAIKVIDHMEEREYIRYTFHGSPYHEVVDFKTKGLWLLEDAFGYG